MEAQTMGTRPTQSRVSCKRRYFPWISWGAIFGGLASGMATYFLLALLGLAAGLTAINPQAAEPVPLVTIIWTGISMVLSAFVGGYVAARMSGLSRLADGIFHGLVAWGVSTLVFAYFTTTSVGSLLGGAQGFIGQRMRMVGGSAATAGVAAGPKSARSAFETLLEGEQADGGITVDSLRELERKLEAGDRSGAIDFMVSSMGLTGERATKLADQGLALFRSSRGLPQETRQASSTAAVGLARVSWGLFVGVLLSLAMGVVGGAIGSRAALRRRNGWQR